MAIQTAPDVRQNTETTTYDARILFVDDDMDLCATLSYALGSGITVTACADPKKAVQNATSPEYDYIIAAHRTPGRDGLELTRRLRERFPFAVIIGTSEEEMGDSFLRAGANDFLKKPFAPYRLAMMIGGDDILA